MSKEKSFYSRLNLLSYCLILILPLILLACGDATTSTFLAPNPTIATVSPGTNSSSSLAARTIAKTTNGVVIPSKTPGTPINTSGGSKAPKSGEEMCAMITKEEAAAILGIVVDKTNPNSGTGFRCNYYSGENLFMQVGFEEGEANKGVLDATKFIYADARQIPGVGDYNLWSGDSGRFEILQGSSYFVVVILSGEMDKIKLLDQATKVAQLVVSKIK